MEDKKDRRPSSRDKPKPKVSSHKPSYSADTGYGSGYASGYDSPRLVERSPDQYKPKPTTDTTRYETIDGKPRKVTYVTKDGKTVKYISRTPAKALDDEYVYPATALTRTQAPGPLVDLYKTKYKVEKQVNNELQKAYEDVNETARYNYDAAVREEAARKLAAEQIEKLEKDLRDLSIEQSKLRSAAAESDRKRIEAEQRYAKRELEVKIAARKEDLKRREKEARLRAEQWDEIEATESPLSPRIKRASTIGLPPVVLQDDKERGEKKVTFKSGYGSGAIATTKPTAAPPASSVFMNPIFEAQADYDRKTKNQGLDEEDRERATGITYTTSKRNPRPERKNAFYK